MYNFPVWMWSASDYVSLLSSYKYVMQICKWNAQDSGGKETSMFANLSHMIQMLNACVRVSVFKIMQVFHVNVQRKVCK